MTPFGARAWEGHRRVIAFRSKRSLDPVCRCRRAAAAYLRAGGGVSFAAAHRHRGEPGALRSLRTRPQPAWPADPHPRCPRHREVFAVSAAAPHAGFRAHRGADAGRARLRPGGRPRGVLRWCPRPAARPPGSAARTPTRSRLHRGRRAIPRRRARVTPCRCSDLRPRAATSRRTTTAESPERCTADRPATTRRGCCTVRSRGSPKPRRCGLTSYQLYAISFWTGLPWLWRLRQPTLVLIGDDDPIVPVVNGRILTRAIPDAHLEVIRGGGHLFPLERPTEIATLVADFLQREDRDQRIATGGAGSA